MPISFSRLMALASKRLATFTQPINKTKPAAASKASSEGRTLATKDSSRGAAVKVIPESGKLGNACR